MSRLSNRFFHRFSSLLALALILAFTGNAVVAPAQSSKYDKHAAKIQHKLAKYRQGSYVHLVMSDATDQYGALGPMADNSFTFTSSESNSTSTYRYVDVDQVKTDRERIGHDSEPIHFRRHMMPIAIGAAAVAAGALTWNAMR